MRGQRTTRWAIAVGLALNSVAATHADGPPRPLRPQPKVIVYQPPTNTPVAVAVMGEVVLPGTYQFPQAPTIALAVQTAKGLKPSAAPMIRIVRGNRVAQRVSMTTAESETLLAGDLVIIDTQAIRDHSAQARSVEPEGVQLALLGVVDRPVVVLVKRSEAGASIISQKLGQSPTAAVQVLPPPNSGRSASNELPNGSVLVFDPRKINVAELPDDLPKIIPCGLPEPDIGGYGLHHAIEERLAAPNPAMVQERAIPWSPAPQPAELSQIPRPTVNENSSTSPTLIPDERLEATLSSNVRSQSPVARVPFTGQQPAAAQSTRLSASAPTETELAADAQNPAWNKVGSAEADLSGMPPAAAGLPWLQIASVLTSLILLGGFVIAIRARQASLPRGRTRRTTLPETPAEPVHAIPLVHRQTNAPIPSPHIPLASFAAPVSSASATAPRTARVAEIRHDREMIFRGILKNELAFVAEPLALRPDLKISPIESEGAFRRVDSSDTALPAPHRSMTTAPHAATAGETHVERHIIDPPHRGRTPGPHVRTGTEAPVERALRQLHGGAR